jgi:undecaprenyl-diphosphatase
VDPIKGLVMGVLQGVLEWLPVSSQGNLVLLAIAFLGLEPGDALSLSVYLHVGTGLAALVYFREEIMRILMRRTEEDRALLRFLVLATIVTGVVGFPLFTFIEVASFYGEALLGLTGVALLATGLMQREREELVKGQERGLAALDGVVMGALQGLAAIPGLSRSGVTTTALLVKGFSGRDAFRVSFIMSIPASFAAAPGLAFTEGLPQLSTGILAALAASFVAALLSIDVLIRLARKTSFWKICVALGLVTLVALLPSLL